MQRGSLVAVVVRMKMISHKNSESFWASTLRQKEHPPKKSRKKCKIERIAFILFLLTNSISYSIPPHDQITTVTPLVSRFRISILPYFQSEKNIMKQKVRKTNRILPTSGEEKKKRSSTAELQLLLFSVVRALTLYRHQLWWGAMLFNPIVHIPISTFREYSRSQSHSLRDFN